MSKNHMEEVAKMLGVELGEVFRIGEGAFPTITFYQFTKTRFLQSKDCDSWTCARAIDLFRLLNGSCPVIKMQQRR